MMTRLCESAKKKQPNKKNDYAVCVYLNYERPCTEAARDSLAEEVEDLTARVKELEAALREAPTSDALAQARAVQVALSTKLQILRKRLTECEARAAAAESKVASLEEILAGKIAELEAMSASERAAKERIVALEHELSLLKGGSAERIAELEALLAESRAAHLEMTRERDDLALELRKTKRHVEDLEAEIVMLKAGDLAIVPRVAKHIKPPFVPTAKTLRLVVGHILAEKAAADVHDDVTPGEQRRGGFVYPTHCFYSRLTFHYSAYSSYIGGEMRGLR